MFIDSNILITWGAVSRKYKKDECVFIEGEVPAYFYQITEGKVRLFNTNFSGKEFTQGEFTTGESFGEPPIFIEEPYPSTAVACEHSVVLKIHKKQFLSLLDEYPFLQKKVIQLLAKRIYNKAVTVREIINNSPEDRIMSFLKAYKKKQCCERTEIEIPYTRQEIANFTGLRVETVIRTLHKMQKLNRVYIVNRKLLF